MFEYLFPLVTSKYLFPVVLLIVAVSLVLRLLKHISTSDREKYDYWKNMLDYPAVVIFAIGIIYYWYSPFTVFSQRILATLIFLFFLFTVTTARYLKRTQMQVYISYLLEAASILSLLWLTLAS